MHNIIKKATTRDLLEAMQADMGQSDASLRVDGGLVVNDWAMQFLSDILGAEVDRPVVTETTALGAAWLAGYQVGLYPGAEGFAQNWVLETKFTPSIELGLREQKYAAWKRAVTATLSV